MGPGNIHSICEILGHKEVESDHCGVSRLRAISQLGSLLAEHARIQSSTLTDLLQGPGSHFFSAALLFFRREDPVSLPEDDDELLRHRSVRLVSARRRLVQLDRGGLNELATHLIPVLRRPDESRFRRPNPASTSGGAP
jgi:hypothetical protein